MLPFEILYLTATIPQKSQSHLFGVSPGGESASDSPLEAVPLVGRMADAIGQFLGLSGLLKSLFDQLCFCVGDCAKSER